jgi:hypothetical protein
MPKQLISLKERKQINKILNLLRKEKRKSTEKLIFKLLREQKEESFGRGYRIATARRGIYEQ